MKNKISKFISLSVLLLLAILFVAKFAGPSILRLYIEAGIGTCQKIPFLCMAPTEEIINPAINEEYAQQLIPYRYPAKLSYPAMEILLPNGFNVTRELKTKVYYKRERQRGNFPTIYLINLKPNFFVKLYPQLKQQGIKDDYEFIRRTMYAKLNELNNLTDAFFVIMKGVFTPDLGNQKSVKMTQFTLGDKKGFINYNLGKSDNYFDCSIFSQNGKFFKIYIKDKGARLDLIKVLTIISKI